MTRIEKGGEPSFWQLARDFLHSYCPKIRRMSPKTVEAYKIGLECYITYLEEIAGIIRFDVCFENLERKYIKGYSQWMQETKKYSLKTVELRLTTLKSFLRYSSYEDISLIALYEAAKAIKAPKRQKKPILYLEQDATAALLSAFVGNTAKDRRNRMILILLYDSAARVSEITDLKLGDLHLNKPMYISLTGKGRKTRNMPLMDKTVEHLKVYLDEHHTNHRKLPGNTPLFYSIRDGKPHALSTDSISLILKSAGDIARLKCMSVPKSLHCHLLRKTRAMDLYREGIPLPLIMQMLGHESMSTTSAFYAFATMDMMVDAIKAANPAAVGEPVNWKTPDIINALYSL